MDAFRAEAAVQPETKYARLGRDRIAYQVLGKGPPDLVMSSGSFGHVDMVWEDPGIALFLGTLASFSRLIFFDRRGAGASDPLALDSLPPWESYTQDLEAVLDEVGSQQTALLTQVDAGPMAMFFAGTKPERTGALILANATARYLADDDYPIGVPVEVAETILAQIDQLWGTEAMAAMMVPSRAGDERFRRWFSKLQRASASPRAAQPLMHAAFEVDVRPLLPLVQAPTLVLHRQSDQILPVEHGRYLAEHIPGAKLVELPGTDASLMWETPELALDLIEEFLTGVRRTADPTRVLATVLFTDIVASTQQATRLGDRRWRQLLTCTTSWPTGWSRSSMGSSSRPPVTGSSPPSTAPAGASAVPPPSGTGWPASTSRSGRASIPARSSCATATSAASRCTSRPG
jgi:pimeloyl-ACP methyl ester carboxylesterase